jgi:hypothetical protein
MCKKGIEENVIPELLQDPRYIPESRPLKRELPRIPIVVSKPYPESNPGAWIQSDVCFFCKGEYTIDEQNNIYFKDPGTGNDVYLNKIDTASYTHKTYATYILNDLSWCTNTVKAPGTGRDTTVYAPVGLHYRIKTEDEVGETIAQRNRVITSNNHVDEILFNMNRQEGLTSNLYEILSTFRHEYIHVSDERDIVFTRKNARKKSNKKYNLDDLSHAEEVYKVQMTYEEFRKAPLNFQQSIIKSYVHHVLNGCREKGIRTGDEVQCKFSIILTAILEKN